MLLLLLFFFFSFNTLVHSCLLHSSFATTQLSKDQNPFMKQSIFCYKHWNTIIILNHWMKKNHHYYHKLHLHIFSQLSNNKIIIIHNLIIYRIMFWFYKHDFASSFHWYFLTFTSKTMSKIIWFQSCTMLVSNIVTHLYVHFTLFFSFRISYYLYILLC